MLIERLRVFQANTDFLFDELLEFLDLVDRAVFEEVNRIWQYSDPDLRQSSFWEIRKIEMDYLWPLLRCYFFITTGFFLFEERLRQLCILVRESNLGLQQEQLGNGIEDYVRFLEKAANGRVKLTDLAEWRAMKDMEKVRDCIVHAFGRIEQMRGKKRKHLERLVKRDKDLSVVERIPNSRQIFPSYAYCRRTLNQAKIFLSQVAELLITQKV